MGLGPIHNTNLSHPMCGMKGEQFIFDAMPTYDNSGYFILNMDLIFITAILLFQIKNNLSHL